ncbi:MAG TPA: sigma factor-like helix-turn-helix DNA-binding protein [bacterium]|nr:MAG: RNA polymerase principal sigma factor HrdA [Parcubacteria group bacterium ADurb.Bin115]HNU81582.1 sigma factor-like helix-turn-helix DNA-binding protein [bacterium]HOD86832.1 sigma factor-like helix-turn-helix DNA-binding protein [bacterium]HQL34595.1 sigma factor-like helix-turn-helix DNA-binding protein [bacterium]
MDNFLESIVRDKRSEELSKLNAIQIVNSLFSDLMDRERDILTRRFGLNGDKNETLEKIGQLHKLTRERVRQIENASIKKIKRLDNLSNYLVTLKSVVEELLKEHGGLLRRDFLLDILTVMSLEMNNDVDINSAEYEKNRQVYKNRFNFILSKLLDDDFDLMPDSSNFNASVKLKEESLEHFEKLSKDLLSKLESLNKTFDTEGVLSLLKSLDSYSQYQDKLEANNSADITPIFKSQIFPDKAEIINSNKTLYSLMQALKDLERNKFGYWGKADWQEIKPKTINDKIYLVLKNAGKPLHFTEIASKINEIKFDHKNANPATVHNELILDERYVLTGRGMYGLREWQNA